MKKKCIITIFTIVFLTIFSFSSNGMETNSVENIEGNQTAEKIKTSWENIVSRSWRICLGISPSMIIPEGVYNNLFIDLFRLDFFLGIENEIISKPSISIQSEIAVLNRNFLIVENTLMNSTNEILWYVGLPIIFKIGTSSIKESLNNDRITLGAGLIPSVLVSAYKEIRKDFETQVEPLEKTHWYDLSAILSISWNVKNTFLNFEIRAIKGVINIVAEPTDYRKVRINNSISLIVSINI